MAEPVVVQEVFGERAFRRRIMELGLVPGTVARVLRVAPLGDPIEIESRGSNLSIRRKEANNILVAPKPAQNRTAR
jgi:ferrous iron transport protein A